MSLILLVTGLVVLTVGAELLVRSAAALALAMRISPLVIGLTVVAFGTSAPELVVSLQSALTGRADLALGNVVGSNIFNVLFILGLAALITPLVVAQQLVWFDAPLTVGISLLVGGMASDQRIGRWDGALLTFCLLVYITWAIVRSRREQSSIQRAYADKFGRTERRPVTIHQLALQTLLLVVGLALLVQGARLLVDAAVAIARNLGVSELFIGLTLVACGTSLPEAATSVVAVLRGQRDIAVGNVVGSCLFNLMGVLGITALIAPTGIAVPLTALRVDLPVMIAVAVACLPVFFTGHRIARWEGALFLAYFAAYEVYLLLSASESSVQRTFSVAMLGFVIPLTCVTLMVAVLGSLRARQ